MFLRFLFHVMKCEAFVAEVIGVRPRLVSIKEFSSQRNIGFEIYTFKLTDYVSYSPFEDRQRIMMICSFLG